MTMFPHRGIVADLCNSLFPMGLRNTETRYFVLCALVSAMIIASFGSGGVALIAKIAVAVTAATELAADINEAIKLL